MEGDDSIFLCECGKLVREELWEDTFKDYISTSRNPSTRTTGHRNCGLIFNFVDGNWPKKYSSRKELKTLAATFAESNKLSCEKTAKFLLEVDRFKSCGKLSDIEILVHAYKNVLKIRESGERIF
ncbi:MULTISPECIES: hypothetical protein [unclassified Methanosarcina]|uniref:hypothetical protein n=1 Tax=unclassified Methanosarcina TaxID=2644672 RepID=UPI001F1FBBED|nr:MULTISPECIES: hypothetical protein [unclassified Methanosarcina]